eukprot:TRINITY_DN3717_c0_g1_i1.p2 TRINITY_DN3717_c0_g1~~TRINITY_DN3717_c0_g1_i1.p2  ORF type:complete len:162 (-),score=19.71 TRINITY_DN3717_c0_g1_i1:816-1301(-)
MLQSYYTFNWKKKNNFIMIDPQEIIEKENQNYLEASEKEDTITLVIELKNCIGSTKMIVSQDYDVIRNELQKIILAEQETSQILYSDLQQIDYPSYYSNHDISALKIKPFFPVFIYLHAIELIDYNNSGLQTADAAIKFFFYPDDTLFSRQSILFNNQMLE